MWVTREESGIRPKLSLRGQIEADEEKNVLGIVDDVSCNTTTQFVTINLEAEKKRVPAPSKMTTGCLSEPRLTT